MTETPSKFSTHPSSSPSPRLSNCSLRGGAGRDSNPRALVYPLVYRQIYRILPPFGQSDGKFATGAGNIRYHRLPASSRPCLARELPHHRVPVCSRDGALRNRLGTIALDLHEEVAKPTVCSIGRARIVLPLQSVRFPDLKQVFSSTPCALGSARPPLQAAVKGAPFVKSESRVGCVKVARLHPIRGVVSQQD